SDVGCLLSVCRLLHYFSTRRSSDLSKLVSVGTIYNEVSRRRPDLIDVLQQPFHFDARGQHPSGLKVQSVPIFNFFQGKLSALYKDRKSTRLELQARENLVCRLPLEK